MQKYLADKNYLDTDGDPRFDHIEVYLASDVDARIAELEKALREVVDAFYDVDSIAADRLPDAIVAATRALMVS